MKHLVTRILKPFNLKLSRSSVLQVELNKASKYDRLVQNLPLFIELTRLHGAPEILEYIVDSKAQLGQDIFALAESGFKRGGFFIEFGATNGVDLSNTYLLEKHFGWNGILAEPAKRWHEALKSNRSCHIETDCVWRDSVSRLSFREVHEGEFSTIGIFQSKDSHDRSRGTSYSVQAISLSDMLAKYNAPSIVDYLSIDTEGSELEILSAFDFSKYQIGVISCEHNFTSDRDKLMILLRANGFQRKHEAFSQFDDWYVRQ